MDEGDVILEARNLVKDFGGFLAVNHASFKVRRGTIHALIGPNGAADQVLGADRGPDFF
jgi:ABC-type branched-subunit amino acid transport system ATPase component